MKKMVSDPSFKVRFSVDIGNVKPALRQTQKDLEPIKLRQYLKNREKANKNTIVDTIKSNSTLISQEEPAQRQIREKKESILKTSEKLIGLLNQKKSNLESKTLEQLDQDDCLIKNLLKTVTKFENSTDRLFDISTRGNIAKKSISVQYKCKQQGTQNLPDLQFSPVDTTYRTKGLQTYTPKSQKVSSDFSSAEVRYNLYSSLGARPLKSSFKRTSDPGRWN